MKGARIAPSKKAASESPWVPRSWHRDHAGHGPAAPVGGSAHEGPGAPSPRVLPAEASRLRPPRSLEAGVTTGAGSPQGAPAREGGPPKDTASTFCTLRSAKWVSRRQVL